MITWLGSGSQDQTMAFHKSQEIYYTSEEESRSLVFFPFAASDNMHQYGVTKSSL
jgi:hypothetical protein